MAIWRFVVQIRRDKRIVEAKADDYLYDIDCLSVKGNQPPLLEVIENFLGDHLQDDFACPQVRRHLTHEKGHD